MQYLNSSFTIQSPDSTEGLSCPRCVFGEKWGEHVEGCLAAYPSIEQQIAELNAAGWMKIRGTIWCSPGGGWFRGPHGAWLVMKKHAR